MKALQQFDNWHKTRQGHAIFAVIELALAYILGSRAIDTGSWWQYAFAFFFLIGSVQNLVHIFRKK
ncbi:MAG: hypothetical protein WCJ24_01125 [Candidatus Saccharibacteria bacterium]